MRLIDDGLWQGGRPEPVNLTRAGVTAIVNLDSNDQDLIEGIECQFMLPIDDAGFPGLAWLEMAVGVIESARRANHVVYVHCHEGISRSVMLVAAYLMKTRRWNVDTAMEWIAVRNEKLNPNRSFMNGLRDWQARLTGSEPS